MCTGKITAISYTVNELCSLSFNFENVVWGRSVNYQKPARACYPHWSVIVSLGRLHYLWMFWLWVSRFYLDRSTGGR